MFAGNKPNGFGKRGLWAPPVSLWTIGILDCDFHFGDGMADILAKKPALAQRIFHRNSGQNFNDGDDPNKFFLWLEESIAEMSEAECDLVLYQAEADMHI